MCSSLPDALTLDVSLVRPALMLMSIPIAFVLPLN